MSDADTHPSRGRETVAGVARPCSDETLPGDGTGPVGLRGVAHINLSVLRWASAPLTRRFGLNDAVTCMHNPARPCRDGGDGR